VAAWLLALFYNFCIKKIQKMLIIQQSPKAIEKYKHRFGFPRNLKLFYACFSEFKDTQIKLDKISHQGG